MDTAEDVVQDVFLKLWNQKDSIQIDKSIQSYLYTMTRNHALAMMRRSDTGQRIYQEIQHTSSNIDMQDVEDAEVEKYLLIDAIYVSIRQLPPKCAEIFTLSKIKGLTYTQIAETLGISVKTVEGQMGKALRLLRTMLADKFPLFCIIMIWFN